MRQQDHGWLVSFEGISGCGKTYLIEALRSRVSIETTTFVTEVVDREGSALDREIINILAKAQDRFFRGGKPRTETFLLLALKMFDYEARIAPALATEHIVIEDRSIDTIAIYQSLLLYPEKSLEQQLEVAYEIYDLAAHWRRAPDLTFLIEDRFDVALKRVEQREGQRLAADERAILQQAAQLYTSYARNYPSRFVLLNRQTLPTDTVLQTISNHLLSQGLQPKEA
ncbi:thymidylate kinase [Ktedonobacteria bacterium brp13]|nr:thymidylate kinase [Ktedonobacteria bacterium brp13]